MRNAYPFATVQLFDGRVDCRLEDATPSEGLDHLSVTEEGGEDTI